MMNKSERLIDIQTHGIDADEALMLSSEKEICKWIDQGLLSEDAYSWWDNAQEDMRFMLAEFY